MENNGVGATSTGGAGASASSDDGASGNDALAAAFDSAINKAAKTLELTTEKGADLYAMKQSVR